MQNESWRVGFIGLISVVLTGCSVGRFVRIEKNRTLYETWSADVRKSVSEGNIRNGMSAEMVRMALGKPDAASTDPSGTYMYWLYPVGDMPAVRIETFPKEEGVARPPGPTEIEVFRGEPASTSMVVFQHGQVVRVENVRTRL